MSTRHLLRRESHELVDHVERSPREGGIAVSGIHVAGDGLDALRQADAGLPAMTTVTLWPADTDCSTQGNEICPLPPM